MQGVDLRKQSSASWMRFLKNWEVKLIFISSNRISKLSGQQMLPRGGRVISGPRGCVRPGCVFLGCFNNQRTSEIRWTHHSDRAGDHATSPCSLKRGWLEPLLRDGLSHRFPDIYCGHLCLRTITKSHFLTPFRRPTPTRPLRKDLSRPFSPFFLSPKALLEPQRSSS